MRSETTIRAWKDPVFRAALSVEELAALPPNPAGAVELTDEELMATIGGTSFGTSNLCLISFLATVIM